MAAPTIANIDADADMELVLNTTHAGVVAYDLPGTANARLLWATGRGNYQRTGSFLVGSLSNSAMQAVPQAPAASDLVTYTISLRNSGPQLDSVVLTNTLPVDVSYFGNLSASSGTAVPTGSGINWSGIVAANELVTIQYAVTVDGSVTTPTVILNEAMVNDGNGNISNLAALIIANGESAYLPVILKR
jgi:uncharacterized repeat protein (TIGR01451 family)